MEHLIKLVLRQDRLAVGFALAAVGSVTWFYLVREGQRFAATGVCDCAAVAIGGPDLSPWQPQTLIPLFLMWIEMMFAMMLPAVAPLVLLFSKVAHSRCERGEPYVPTFFFASGYFSVWSVFSLGAAVAQWVLHGTALLSSEMASSTPLLAAALFVSAGLFQFSPLKTTCLNHCRAPLTFLMTEWRDGRRGAFLMGWKHGLFCTLCCWLLMLLLFAVGVMNIVWIVALALFALVERVSPRSWHVAQASGVGLIVFGAWLALTKL